MAKINYARVEQQLVKGLRKMFVKKLHERAGKASVPLAPGEVREEVANPEEAKQRMLEAVQYDLQQLNKKTTELHSRLGITEHELGHLVDDPASLSAEDWEQLHELKESIDKESEQVRKQLRDDGSDDRQVEEEINLHKYKRFNVRKGWVPLDTHAPPPPKFKRKPGSWDVVQEEEKKKEKE
jgi:hypothetical protein